MSSRTKSVKVAPPKAPVKVVKTETDNGTHWILDLAIFSLIAVWSAYYNGIWDCDESMNYFEPLHHLFFGYGLQTWEYRFVLRFPPFYDCFLLSISPL